MSQLLNTAKRHSIVAAYEFDEASGNLLDKIGSNNGTASGTPVYGATDQLGGTEAIEFDGSTDYFTLTSTPFDAIAAYTVEFVFKLDSLSGTLTILGGRDATNDGPVFYVASSKLRAAHNTVTVSSTTTLVTGQWYHGAATWDGATLKVYVDGVDEASGAVATALSVTRIPTIGRLANATSGYFNGDISYVAIYDEALSATDIQELYQAGRLKPSLTLHHDLSASAIDSNLTSYAGRVASNNFSASEVAAIFAADSGSGADVWFSSDASGATPIDAKLLYWSDGDSVFAFDVAIASASSSTGATVYLQVGNKPSGYGTDPYDANTLAVTPLISDGTDDSSNGNNVTATGSPTFGGSTGPDGALPATDLDGSSQYFTYGSNLLNGASAWTMEAHIRSDTTGSTQRVLDERDAAGDGPAVTFASNDKLQASNNSVTSSSATSLSADQYYHLAGRWDGADVSILIDGSVDGTDPDATAISTTTALAIGRNAFSDLQHFDGEIANVYISDTDRSDAWLNANYLLRGSSASTYWTVTDISSSDPLGDKSIELGASHVYVFDEASGKLLDRVGSNDGTASGTPTYRESDQRGLPSAIGFDGSSDYFTLGSNILNGQSAYTVEALVKYTGDGLLTAVFYSDRDASDDGVLSYFTASTGGFRASHNATDLDSTTLATDGEWHHVVTTWDGSTFSMYVDGSLEDSAAVATSLSTTTAAVIGRDSGGSLPFPGDISHVAIYPRALTATEVGELYEAGLSKPQATNRLVYSLVNSLTYGLV